MATKKSTTTKKKTTTPRTKVTTVTTVAKQAPSAARANRLTFLSLPRLWAVALAGFVVLAVAAAFLMEPASYLLTQTHLTSDVLLSQNTTTFVSASRGVMDVQLRWLLVIMLGLSAVFPLLYLTRLKDYAADRINKRRAFPSRWVDLALSSALMLSIIALLSGYNDVATLKLIATAVVATCGLGWIAEQQNEVASKPVWSAFRLSIFTAAMPWLMLAWASLSTILFGDVRSPWYSYAAAGVGLVGAVLIMINQGKQHSGKGNWADYASVERNYVVISTTTKVAFAIILIVGLAK